MVSKVSPLVAHSQIDLLRETYLLGLKGESVSVARLARSLGESSRVTRGAVAAALRRGRVRLSGNEVGLTASGRRRLKVVMMGGAFEIIHPGHILAMREARGLGNTLVVVVATDESVERNKGRPPATDQASRVALVSSQREVDLALPGKKGSIFDILTEIRPDVVALGYDQHHNSEEIVAEAGRRGIKVKAARLGSPIPNVKTSKILLSM